LEGAYLHIPQVGLLYLSFLTRGPSEQCVKSPQVEITRQRNMAFHLPQKRVDVALARRERAYVAQLHVQQLQADVALILEVTKFSFGRVPPQLQEHDQLFL
jgi:hypothetical protein